MPEVVDSLGSAAESELLGRIALMTGAGFGLKDISQRLLMDMGYELDEMFVRVLQVELGLARNTPRVDLQRRFIGWGLSPYDASCLANLVWEYPAKAGIDLAAREMAVRGPILFGLPRGISQPLRAAADLYAIFVGGKGATLATIQRLLTLAKLTERELQALLPAAGNQTRGVGLRLALPRGKGLAELRQG